MVASRQIFANTLSSWVGTAINGVVGFFLVPLLLLRLGKEGYGLTALLASVLSLTILLDLGLRGALSRFLAEHVAQKDEQKFNHLVSSALFLYLLIAGSCAVCCIAFAAPIARVFHFPAASLVQGENLIRWYGSGMILLGFIGPVYNGTVIAVGRFDVLNTIAVIVALIRAAGLVLALGLWNGGLYAWALVTFATTALNVFATAVMARRVWPGLRIRIQSVRVAALRPLFVFGGYLFAIQAYQLISMQSDPIVLSTFLGPAAVALYSPALALVSVVRPVISTLSDQLSPFATHFHVQGEHEQMQALLLRGTRYTLLMGVLAFVVLTMFAEPITAIWLGKSLGADHKIVARVLIAWALVDLGTYAYGSQWPVLQARKRLSLLVRVGTVLAVMNIALSVYFVGYTRLGVVGVVIPTIMQRAVSLIIFPGYTARLCGISLRRYFVSSYLRPLGVGLVLALAAWGIKLMAPPNTIWLLSLECALILLFWCALSWGMVFEPAERTGFRDLLTRRQFRPAATVASA